MKNCEKIVDLERLISEYKKLVAIREQSLRESQLVVESLSLELEKEMGK